MAITKKSYLRVTLFTLLFMLSSCSQSSSNTNLYTYDECIKIILSPGDYEKWINDEINLSKYEELINLCIKGELENSQNNTVDNVIEENEDNPPTSIQTSGTENSKQSNSRVDIKGFDTNSNEEMGKWPMVYSFNNLQDSSINHEQDIISGTFNGKNVKKIQLIL